MLKNFKKNIKYIIKNAPKNWDIIYIGGCYIKGKLTKKKFIKPTIYNSRFNLCTHGFILNKKISIRLII